MKRVTNLQRDHPRQHYSIHDNGDGTVDVYLVPSFAVYKTDIGIDEYDIDMRVVKGIIPWDGMEDDIRIRYYDWLNSAEAIDL